jgi:hypothetical protein
MFVHIDGPARESELAGGDQSGDAGANDRCSHPAYSEARLGQ